MVVAFSPDGKLLATADDDGTVRLWNPATGRPASAPIQATGRGFSVVGVAFSPDGKLLASADGDGTVRLWDPATSQAIRTIHVTGSPDYMVGVTFSPGGSCWPAPISRAVRLWDTVTGRAVRTIEAHQLQERPVRRGVQPGRQAARQRPRRDRAVVESGHRPDRPHHPRRTTSPDGSVTEVAFSPDGKLLAGAGSDGTVRLWDPATGQTIRTIRAGTTGPNGGVNEVAFSPDGKLLASAGGDGTVRLWRVPLFTHPYEALCTYVGPPARQDWNQYAPGEPQPKVCT